MKNKKKNKKNQKKKSTKFKLLADNPSLDKDWPVSGLGLLDYYLLSHVSAYKHVILHGQSASIKKQHGVV